MRRLHRPFVQCDAAESGRAVRRLAGIVVVAAFVGATCAQAGKLPDPRTCGYKSPCSEPWQKCGTGSMMSNLPADADRPKPRSWCSHDAAVAILKTTVASRIGTKSWDAQISCAPRGTLLRYRCRWLGSSPVPAALIRWDPVSFRPSVTFGPAGVAWLIAAKARVGAAQAANG